MATNAIRFIKAVRQDVAKVEKAYIKFHRAVHLEALRRIIKRTPSDTGRLRGNWQTTVGAPASGTVPKDVNAISQGLAVLSQLGLFETTWITNNLDYASYIENGQFVPPDPGPSKDPRKGRKGRVLVKGGYSVQAPQGMVAITLDELRPLVQG